MEKLNSDGKCLSKCKGFCALNLEEILTPAFVVTVVLTYLMPKLSPYIDRAISFLRMLMVRTLPLTIRGYVRRRRLQVVRKIKNNRRNAAAINYQISKANSAFLLFVGVIFFYILLIILGPFKELLRVNFLFGISATLPIYIFELFWIVEDAKAKRLVEHAGKIRVKNRM